MNTLNDPSSNDQPLAKLGGSADDASGLSSGLEAGTPAPVVSHRKKSSSVQADPPLPAGSVLACRKSGGFAFSSRLLTVYRDGRVISQSEGFGGRRESSFRMEAAAFGALMRAVLAAGFATPRFGSPSTIADGYVYELAARISRRVYRHELAQGAIPESYQPLIDQLDTLLLQASDNETSQ